VVDSVWDTTIVDRFDSLHRCKHGTTVARTAQQKEGGPHIMRMIIEALGDDFSETIVTKTNVVHGSLLHGRHIKGKQLLDQTSVYTRS
jgi:hypothetical protein